jgi:hypothetical protein
MPGCCRLGLVTSLVALTLGSVLAGCDSEADLVPAETFVEGIAKDSDAGAFRVMLTTADGFEVGENTLFVRLGFHDPHDPLAPGRGIPGADVMLDAWMPHDEGAVDGLRGVYVGDGQYAIDLDVASPGVWQLDFELGVGDGVRDSVSFAFVVGE